MSRWAAILAGGSGTRFWPLSTAASPKQFLDLVSDRPLLAETVERLDGTIPRDRTVIVTGHAYAEATRALLPDIPPENVLAEPHPAGTGPALAWATSVIKARDEDATIVSLHADWFVGDDDGFRETVGRALSAAETLDRLITVGVVPTRAEIGYGYIEPGEPLSEHARDVIRFTEKPDATLAAELVERGALWNSGMFAWTAARFMAETHAHAPEIASSLALVERGDVAGFFAGVTPIVIDKSHYERSARVATVPGSFPWDDVGNWAALARVRSRDANDNVLVGDTFSRGARGCVVWAGNEPIVVDGVSDLVIAQCNGVTLVTTRARASKLKELYDALPEALRERPGRPG